MSTLTDEDLMLYADGELDEPRQAEVEALLGRDERARAKLAAQRLIGETVRERARALVGPAGAPSPLEGLADAVMARVAVEPKGAAAVAPAPAEHLAKVLPFDRARLASGAATPAAGRAQRVRSAEAGPSSVASRNNSRSIFILAAAAMAAAAGMTFWARMEPPSPAVQELVAAGPKEAAQPTTGSAAAEERPRPPEADEDVGVEVAAVDFGSLSGAIFYVPTDGAEKGLTTTVVWVNDPGGEER